MTASLGLHLGALQFAFAATCIVYGVFLPQLVVQAGPPKAAAGWIVMLDQLIFRLADFACGVTADRVTGRRRFAADVDAAVLDRLQPRHVPVLARLQALDRAARAGCCSGRRGRIRAGGGGGSESLAARDQPAAGRCGPGRRDHGGAGMGACAWRQRPCRHLCRRVVVGARAGHARAHGESDRRVAERRCHRRSALPVAFPRLAAGGDAAVVAAGRPKDQPPSCRHR